MRPSDAHATDLRLRTCLVLSDSPVPSASRARVEGGGLRSWGLARGLTANASGFSVVLAEPADDGIASTEVVVREGVSVVTWTAGSLASLVQSFDTVLVSYCGRTAPAVLAALQAGQQLVLDCNVPIYVEISARGSTARGREALDSEYRAFMGMVPAVNRALLRGDLFACANERQALYYQGVLSALGRVNPVTYGSDLLRLVPYGVHDGPTGARARPIDALTGRPASIKLLWFGALYPWFDISLLLEAVALLNDEGTDVSLTIVGARNPSSTNPDFLATFEAFDRLMLQPRFMAHTFSHPWVDYQNCGDWFLNADLGVMIGKAGLENSLAWRTRLVDMVGGRLPVATSPGDPLADLLIARKAAVSLRVGSARELADDLAAALASQSGRSALRARLEEVREELLWPTVTRTLAAEIRAGTLAPDRSAHCQALIPVPESQPRRLGHKVVRKSRNLLRRLRDEGLFASLQRVGRRLARPR